MPLKTALKSGRTEPLKHRPSAPRCSSSARFALLRFTPIRYAQLRFAPLRSTLLCSTTLCSTSRHSILPHYMGRCMPHYSLLSSNIEKIVATNYPTSPPDLLGRQSLT